jgi:hypothetical protein
MRPAELVFLALLTVYHAVLLVPRNRRPFPSNYLIFLAGMALAWNLGLEGFRWQSIPPLVLLLADLVYLFPTFRTLRGREPAPGWLPALGRGLRTLIASVALLLAVGADLLAVAFPLPLVGLTGGLPPAQRVVRFAAEGDLPALEVKLWYPASGDFTPRPRPVGEAPSWQRVRADGGLATFWQAYQSELPSNLIVGGKVASPGNRYPVVYVALPPGQDADDFGYLFEDLASRGFVVASGTPLSAPSPESVEFSWHGVLADLTEPLQRPELWSEPDRKWGATPSPTDFRWLGATVRALGQLDDEPGDVLFSAVDLQHQVLWSWGSGPALPPEELDRLGLRGQIHAGGTPDLQSSGTKPELWILGGRAMTGGRPGQWFLTLPKLHRADLSDAAFLKPYLVFFGLKSQLDAGAHGALRQYQAAFFQYTLWGSGGEGAFGQTVPEVPGLTLTGQ